jgi:UDP-N-acetylmuramoyl-tripeptide--D-alanyl-D-alanine ligase
MGDSTEAVHRELADRAADSGFDAVYFLGPSHAIFADQMKRQGFRKTLVVSNSYENSLAAKWALVLEPKDLILMKGSRGMQLERVLKELQPIDFGDKN